MRDVWIGTTKPSIGWWESASPDALSIISDVDRLAIEWNIRTGDGGSLNALWAVALMAQTGKWPKEGIYIYEADEGKRKSLLSFIDKVAPADLAIYAVGGEGQWEKQERSTGDERGSNRPADEGAR